MPDLLILCILQAQTLAYFLLSMQGPDKYSYLDAESKSVDRARLKRDGTHAETRFSFSAKRTSPFKLVGGSVQSTTGSCGLRISSSNGSNAGYPMF